VREHLARIPITQLRSAVHVVAAHVPSTMLMRLYIIPCVIAYIYMLGGGGGDGVVAECGTSFQELYRIRDMMRFVYWEVNPVAAWPWWISLFDPLVIPVQRRNDHSW
jgi:hypothetical protein